MPCASGSSDESDSEELSPLLHSEDSDPLPFFDDESVSDSHSSAKGLEHIIHSADWTETLPITRADL